MALANYNVTLEYATNTLQFGLTDNDGAPANFDVLTYMHIKRADGSGISQTFNVTGAGTDQITIVVSPNKGDGTTGLWKEGDSIFDYELQHPEHIWSLQSDSQVYISGTMNLLESAGS
jgi:hypothetical protein